MLGTAMQPLCLVIITLLQIYLSTAGDLKTYQLREIKYADLVTLDADVGKSVADILTSVGALQITGIPRFAAVRKRALEDLSECFETEGADSVLTMADGTKRLSCGAASRRGVPGPMSHFCGEASEKLRAVVDAAARQLFLALDAAAGNAHKPSTVMGPNYNTLSQVMANGDHLEHLHAYVGTGKTSHNAATLNFHVDAGLMIAMTTGYYSQEPNDASGLYISLPDNSRAKVVAQDDALIILVGDGAVNWLAPLFPKPFHAPSHALIAELSAGASRSWYGKMYLPPADAIVSQAQMTFSEYHALQAKHSVALSIASRNDSSQLGEMLPSACGGKLVHPYGLSYGSIAQEESRYLSTVGDNCGSDAIYCWARCMDVSNLPCGTDAVCWDTKTDQPFPNPNEMCMADGGYYCEPRCATSNSSFDGYCFGEGTSMSMQGFVSIVQEGEGKTACFNLLFKEWTLDSKAKYAAGCLGVFAMCILIQYLSALRSQVGHMPNNYLRMFLNVILYALHVTLGYFAMLVAMTYSVELFCMICSGLTVGFVLFHLRAPMDVKNTDPCCAELEDDIHLYHKLESARLDERRRLTPAMSINVREVVDDYGECCGGGQYGASAPPKSL